MATVAVLGGGHVGLVHAAGLADLGHTVRVVDVDREKVERLRRGEIPFYEPSLAELLARGTARGRLSFTSSYARGLRGAAFVLVCLPTPTAPGGGDLDGTFLRQALLRLRRHLRQPLPIVVNKSTVPVGTADQMSSLFGGLRVSVVSNPEFLAEGRAVQDFFRPSRIVIGAHDRDAATAVAALYRGLDTPIVLTDNATAEFSKLAANAFLAMKVSFANALAQLSEAVGADVESLTHVLALDSRIGSHHLQAGLGFGGSCFPKDVAAIEHLARRHQSNADVFSAVLRINREQRQRVIEHLGDRLDGVRGRRIAILGLAFKAGTDDVREAPAVAIAKELLALGAKVAVYDPLVRMELANGPARATAAATPLEAASAADAVIFATEWAELASIDLFQLRAAMRGRVLVDGRGIVPPGAARQAGFDYFGFGRGGPPAAAAATAVSDEPVSAKAS